jgi:hypothetical protein
MIFAQTVFVALVDGKPVAESEPVLLVIQSRPDALSELLASPEDHWRDLGIWLELNAAKMVKAPGAAKLIKDLEAKG